jgi:hypothetical protein
MPSLEERVAYLEGKVEEQTGGFGESRRLIGAMDQRMIGMEARFDARFSQVDVRFAQIDARFDRLEEKIDRHFTWLVGIQVAWMIAAIGAFASLFSR